jgi:hypothetical protein
VSEGITDRQEEISRSLRAASINLRKMDVVEPSLEDVFISTVKHNQQEVLSNR